MRRTLKTFSQTSNHEWWLFIMLLLHLQSQTLSQAKPSHELCTENADLMVLKIHSPWYFFSSLPLLCFQFASLSLIVDRERCVCGALVNSITKRREKKIINVLLSLSPRWTRRVIYVKYLQEIIVNYEKTSSSFVFPRWFSKKNKTHTHRFWVEIERENPYVLHETLM